MYFVNNGTGEAPNTSNIPVPHWPAGVSVTDDTGLGSLNVICEAPVKILAGSHNTSRNS